jgi:hypothetical protein
MSLETPSPYNKLPADHEAVEKYEPTFIARGGDHLVYEAKGHPDTVIKASTFKIKDILEENEEKGLAPDALTEDTRAALEKEVFGKNAQIRLFREYFGTEHTLSERRYLMQVPISPEIIEEIFKDDHRKREAPLGIEAVRDMWTAAVIQKKAPEIADPNHLGLYFGNFLEERRIQPEPTDYEKLNDAFLGKDTITPEDLELFFRTQDNPKTHALADLLAKAEQDPKLKIAIADFIRKSIRFAKETGNILALAGEDNVVLSEKDGEWNYLLVDAIPLYNEPIYSEAKEAKVRVENEEELLGNDIAFIVRAKNFVRTMNGLAAALGIEDRIAF